MTKTNNEYLVVLNALPYQATREALYKNKFVQAEGSPWPTALFTSTGTKGSAQLRPLDVDNSQLFLSPENLEHWTALMWRQREELSDLDADALDALSAMWLVQVQRPNDDAVATLDDLLRLRQLEPKRDKRGDRAGFRPEQRQAMLRALWHIQNLWINVSQMDVYEQTGDKRGQKTTRAIQSRAFIITDRMGQLRLDGSMDVDRFIFRPGKVFAHFLFGPGRQTAMLAAKALHYDPYRQTWEKRLARYLSWQWRIQARRENYLRPYRIATLLEAVGEELKTSRPNRTKERMEKALNTLESDRVIAAWQYEEGWNEAMMEKRRWSKKWLQATVLIEPPDAIQEQYRRIAKVLKNAAALPESDENAPSLAQRIKRHRKQLGFTQLQAAEQLGISQGYFSLIERGKADEERLTILVRRSIERWLAITQ